MVDKTVRTGVDDLLDFLKRVDKIPLLDCAAKLNVNAATLQSWVDFLVEEDVLGIEYKFTKPIIYLNRPAQENKARVKAEAEAGIDAYKADFRARASEKSIPVEKLSFLWQEHVKAALNRRRDFFVREAKKRNLANIDLLWSMYTDRLLSE